MSAKPDGIIQEVERDGWVCACVKRDRAGNMTHIKINPAKRLRCRKCKGTRTGYIQLLREEREAAKPKRKTLYVASKVKHAPMWRQHRESLRVYGYDIISTWIDEDGEGQTKDYGELADRCIKEAVAADEFILYCEPDEVMKGGLIEAGARLGAGKTVRSAGQCKNWSTTFAQHPLWKAYDFLSDAMGEMPR